VEHLIGHLVLPGGRETLEPIASSLKNGLQPLPLVFVA
jgi:hypothetical protein